MADAPYEHEAARLAEEPFDASDPAAVNRARKKAARLERERLQFIQEIMDKRHGRRWVHELLVKAKVFSTPFLHGSTDGTAFNCGAQNLGLQILADITLAAPDKYIVMMKEANDQR